MLTLSDLIKLSCSTSTLYLRFYELEPEKAYKQLSLDISKL